MTLTEVEELELYLDALADAVEDGNMNPASTVALLRGVVARLSQVARG
jgi:hypothetical protein